MKLLVILLFLFSWVPLSEAADRVKPRVAITKVLKTKRGTITTLDFYIKASDNRRVRAVQCRAAVDGKQGPWRRYAYFSYPGYPFHLPFGVDCDIFVFEVRSIDSSGNKSRIVKRSFSGL